MSFILSGKWLEISAKASTGDAIASQLALQAPTFLPVEEEDGVLVEREIDSDLLVECIASYLVLSTSATSPVQKTIKCDLVVVEQQQPTRRHCALHPIWR